jgi:repressor LexA
VRPKTPPPPKPERLTDADCLARLRDYYARHRVLPSYSGIRELLGVKAKSHAAYRVARLREQGFVEAGADGRLAPTTKFLERALVGQARAGHPEAAVEQGEMLAIDAFLVPNPSRTVLVKVRGDSMKDDGLLDGDFVVVERGRHAVPGDVVVAVVDGEQTIKRLAKERERFVLQPANAAYPVIRPQGALEIYGVVTGKFGRL